MPSSRRNVRRHWPGCALRKTPCLYLERHACAAPAIRADLFREPRRHMLAPYWLAMTFGVVESSAMRCKIVFAAILAVWIPASRPIEHRLGDAVIVSTNPPSLVRVPHQQRPPSGRRRHRQSGRNADAASSPQAVDIDFAATYRPARVRCCWLPLTKSSDGNFPLTATGLPVLPTPSSCRVREISALPARHASCPAAWRRLPRSEGGEKRAAARLIRVRGDPFRRAGKPSSSGDRAGRDYRIPPFT